jgi:hypothetical protein
VSTEAFLLLAGIACEAALVALFAWKRAYRRLPVFCGYIAWGLFSDGMMSLLRTRFPSEYLHFYLVEMCLDSLFQYCVLVELAWSVLRPFRASLSFGFFLRVSLVIVLLGAVAWPFATVQGSAALRPDWFFAVRIQQTFSVLRILFFLAMATGSHTLSIGWRGRELQVATGLGFYSFASLIASIVHTHQSAGTAFHSVDVAVAASYVCSLLYWLVSFAQKEPPRREFTPQMRGFLEVMAGEVRARHHDADKSGDTHQPKDE